VPAPAGEPAPIAGMGYELVFEDDFEGTSLNTDVWAPPPHHGTSFPGGAISVAGSILTVTADFDGVPRNWVEIWSLGQQSPTPPRYPNALAWEEGYFEVRCRTTNDPWTKLALWTFNLEQQNYYGFTRPFNTLNAEWDMVENGNRAGFAGPTAYADVNHVHVRHRNTSAVNGIPDKSDLAFSNGTGLCDWHTWSGIWTGGSIRTYLDGTLLTTLATYDAFAQPMPFILGSYPLAYSQAQIDLWSIPAPPAAIVTDYDWFRVWQLPKNFRRSTLLLTGASGGYASTPDHASLRITGDIDIRCEFTADDPTPVAVSALVNRATGAPNWSYQLALRSNGVVRLAWSADGTTILSADSNVLPIVPGQRICVRAALDVDNGSSQRSTTFYTAPGRNGPWTLLNTVTTAGVTSILAGTRALEFGARNSGTQEMLAGSLYWAEVRDGIDGTVVSRFDATDKTPGSAVFTDETGKVYTVFGSAKIMPGNPKPDLYRTVSSLRLA